MINLSVSGVGHKYGYRTIFRDVDLALTSGDVFAITGANGSGKSTLLKIISGILQPCEGQVILTISGHRIPREHCPLHIGLVAPYVNLYEDFTLYENLAFIAKARSMKMEMTKIESIVSLVRLTSHANSLVRTYSTGMQQRSRFVAALFHEPMVLLLDEPTVGLDAQGRELVKTIIDHAKQAGHLVVIASNVPGEIKLASQSLCIEKYASISANDIDSSKK